MIDLWYDLLDAIQFLTRLPVPAHVYRPDSLARSTKFFPLVGLLVGLVAGVLYLLLNPHLPRLATAALVLLALVLLTGAFHEDGLADAADGFGGGNTPAQMLAIFRDSRLGTYGVTALTLSLATRLILIAALAPARVLPTLIAAHVLSRWTTLPLSRFLPSARPADDGQGVRVASQTSNSALLFASSLTLAIVSPLLRVQAIAPILAAISLTFLTGLYYRSRLGGVTGDCFGATNQLTEIAIYFTAVWMA